MEITTRIATPQDAKSLLDIYAPYVKNTAITFEYEVPSLQEFTDRITHTLQKYPYIVAEINNKIVGYAYASAFNERPAANWTTEVSIYVEQNSKKMGIGKKLYKTLEKILLLQNIVNVTACVAYPEQNDEYLNTNSLNFHVHMGYTIVGKFYKCGYKFHRWYHIIWLEKHIASHIAKQPPFQKFDDIKPIIVHKGNIIL